jgi:hypothetical protein
MGASGRVAAVGKIRRPTVVYRQEATNNKPKTSGWPGASPFRATAGPVVFEGFLRERVQASGRYIVFDFTVPGCGVEFGKPCSECVEFGRSGPLNGLLDAFTLLMTFGLQYALLRQSSRRRCRDPSVSPTPL